MLLRRPASPGDRGIAQTGYPVGPVVAATIQRVAIAMLEFDLLRHEAATEVKQKTLIGSMAGPVS